MGQQTLDELRLTAGTRHQKRSEVRVQGQVSLHECFCFPAAEGLEVNSTQRAVMTCPELQ